MSAFLIVNFGGPRNLEEIPGFLTTLLTDEDVLWTGWPSFIQKWLFRRIAKARSKTIVHDYQMIGGKSPIFAMTEEVAAKIRELTNTKVLTYHRYLPATHDRFIEEMKSLEEEKVIVFPMFPQFSYATTGSIARWMSQHLDQRTLSRLHWVKSYAANPLFIECQKQLLSSFLAEHDLESEETLLFFSMHGLPKCFVCHGDPYEQECRSSYQALAKEFPKCKTVLAFQSKFGPAEWLRPYTDETCLEVEAKNVVFVPLSFTSDHIETLFEIEKQYLPILRKRGMRAYRCPALNNQSCWMEAIPNIIANEKLFETRCLIRSGPKRSLCQDKCKKSSQRTNKQIKSGCNDPACDLIKR